MPGRFSSWFVVMRGLRDAETDWLVLYSSGANRVYALQPANGCDPRNAGLCFAGLRFGGSMPRRPARLRADASGKAHAPRFLRTVALRSG